MAGQRGPSRKRRRQPPTIDLTATDVRETPQPNTATGSTQEAAAAPPSDETAAENPVSASGADVPPPLPDQVGAASPDPVLEPAVTGSRAEEAAARLEPEPSISSGHDGPEREPRVAAPSPPPSATPVWPILAAALGGAGLIGALFALLQLSGALTPTMTLTDTSGVDAKLGQIERQLRDIAARPAPAVDSRNGDLTQRLGAVEQAIRNLPALDSRLSRAETALSNPRPGDPALADRVAAMESAAKSLADRVADLRERADGAAKAAQDARTRADTAASTAEAAAVAARDAGQKASQPAAPSADPAEVETLATRVAQIERALKGVQDGLAKMASQPVVDRAARLAFAASMLRSIVERGEPFAAELAALKPLLSDPKMAAPLEAVAASGVPSIQALQRDFQKIAPQIVEATRTTAPDAGLMERLQAGAEKLVRIRPVSETPGDDPAAVVARVEVRLGRGDVASAVTEAQKLPANVQSLAASWLKLAQTRVAALEAVRKLSADALASLTPAP